MSSSEGPCYSAHRERTHSVARESEYILIISALTCNYNSLSFTQLQVVLGCFKETKLGRGRNREFAVRPDGRGVAIAVSGPEV